MGKCLPRKDLTKRTCPSALFFRTDLTKETPLPIILVVTVKKKTGADLLREWLDRSKLNQREGAQTLRLSESYMCKIMTGKRLPGRKNAIELERQTGIPVEGW